MQKIKICLLFILDLFFPRDAEILELQNLPRDEIFLKFRQSPNTKNLISLFSYKDPLVKKLIWQMKFKENRWAAKIFGDFLAEKISNEILGRFDDNFLLIPVPIHKKRLAERGYNQCEWLCQEIMRHLSQNFSDKISYQPKILQRKIYTAKQSWSNREDRLKNISGVFELRKNSSIRGAQIILVDDVYTTGATMNEASRILEEFGAAKIYCVVIAH